MNKVYIVTGETGEYDDKQDWFVAAYGDHEQAQAHCDRLNLIVSSTTVGDLESATITELRDRIKARIGNLDPRFQFDYTGTVYGVAELPFFVHFDQFLEVAGI